MKHLLILLCLFSAAIHGQNVTVEVGAKPVGTRAALNFESGNGVMEVCRDEGAAVNRITCAPSYNSALLSTHDSVHNNENFCLSTNGTTQYTCRLPYKVISSYQTGMTFVLVADATCRASCSLNVDVVGPAMIKRSDGATDPGGALIAGEPQWVFYDGKVFRLMGGRGGDNSGRGNDSTARSSGNTSPSAESPSPRPGIPSPAADDAKNQRDATARRFIASLETIPYASTVTLETTAGDMHKTTTSNSVGNATIRAATGGLAGQHMWVIIVNDQLSAKTITFGEHLKSAGPLTGAPGKSATLQFISDGSVWYEVARTTNL